MIWTAFGPGRGGPWRALPVAAASQLPVDNGYTYRQAPHARAAAPHARAAAPNAPKQLGFEPFERGGAAAQNKLLSK